MSEDLVTLFKALAHPKRLAILQALQVGETCVCELEEQLELRQAYLSQQLSVLREAGLVCYRRDGWNVHYRLAHPEVLTLLDDAESVSAQLGPCAFTPVEEGSTESCCAVKTEELA